MGHVYPLVFGVGTIVGMMLITMIIAAPCLHRQRFTSFNRGLTVASGLISVAFGLFITVHIGFIDGLLSAHPHWIPS